MVFFLVNLERMGDHMQKAFLLITALLFLFSCQENTNPSQDDTAATDTDIISQDDILNPDDDIDTYIVPDDIGVMVEIPAGEFMRGCNEAVDDECALDAELPYRSIYISAFKIDKYEVTTAQFAECVKAGACIEYEGEGLDRIMYYLSGKNAPGCNLDSPGRENYPMNCVSWLGAKTYCEWIEKRLPTEAEWEKAARGTDGRKYPWGNEPYVCCDYVNEFDSGYISEDKTVIAEGCGLDDSIPVGNKPKGVSPYGLQDMIGNVEEWVNDRYDAYYYQSSPTEDPPGPEIGNPIPSEGYRDYRIIRGGSWKEVTLDLRVSARSLSYLPEDYIIDMVGFRCAESI